MLSFVNFAFAQCDFNNISTDPSQPLNSLHSDYANQFFDWTKINYENINWDNNDNWIRNPFHITSGQVSHFSNTYDYLPEAGWELISYNFGYKLNGSTAISNNKHIYMILYNKYRSIIRVFVSLGNNIPEAYSLSSIQLRFPSTSFNTALFSAIERFQQPVRYFNPLLIENSVKDYSNGGGRWMYADFPVMYDPCTCMEYDSEPKKVSELRLDVSLIDEVKLELKGHSTGKLEMARKDAGQPANSNFNNFWGTVNRTQNQLEKGVKYYKNISSFLGENNQESDSEDTKDKEKIKSGLQRLTTHLSNQNVFTSNVLGVLPYISEGLALLDLFVGGTRSNTPAAITFPPMSMNQSHIFSGNLYSNHNYVDNKLFYTPGSIFNLSPDAETGFDEKYPLYNEILGVYNLLETPKAYHASQFVWNTEEFVSTQKGWKYEGLHRIAYRLVDNSINIVVNPASKLELEETYGQFLIVFDDTNADFTFKNNDDFVQISNNKIISKMMPISCMYNHPFFLEYENETVRHRLNGESYSDPVIVNKINKFNHQSYFVFTGSFKTENNENYIHRHTFSMASIWVEIDVNDWGPVNKHKHHASFDWLGNQTFGFLNSDWSFINTQNNIIIENEIVNSSYYAYENITVNKTSVIESSSGELINIRAGQSIEINHGTIINPKSELKIGIFDKSCENVNLSTSEHVMDVCQSEEYINRAQYVPPSISNDSITINTNETTSNLKFTIFPNPASESIQIKIVEYDVPKITDLKANVKLHDLNGKMLLDTSIEFSKDDLSNSISINKFPSGIYILQFNFLDGSVHREKIIITR